MQKAFALVASIAQMTAAFGALAADTNPNDAAVRAVMKEMEAVTNKRDFAALAAMFATSGDIIAFQEARDVGRDAIRRGFEASWKGQPASCRIALRVDSVRFIQADLALVEDTATFSGCMDVPPDRATFVMVRREGKWQIEAMRIFQALK